MPGPVYPRFRKSTSGELLLSYSEEGRKAQQKKEGWCRPCTAQQVEKDATERVIARQGDVEDEKDVLGEYVLQFGMFKGKTFRWVLENVPGFVGWLVSSMNEEEGKEDGSSQHQQKNKAALKKYTMMFEEGRRIVEMKAAEKNMTKIQNKPQSKWNALLVNKRMSPEQIQKGVERVLSPPKYKPNVPSREVHSFPSRDDEDLIACLDEYETSRQSLPQYKVSSTTVKQTSVKRSLFQASETTLAPAPKENPLQQQLTVQLEPELRTVSSEVGAIPESSELLLYEGWRSTLPEVDQLWISKSFFGLSHRNKVEFKTDKVNQLWFEPPQPSLHTHARNRICRYFAHRLFLWMPVNIWGVRLHCPHKDSTNRIPCNGILTRSGIHQKTRLTLDIDSFYIMASEYLACSKCGKKLVAWAHSIVSQLDEDRQLLFPCILTQKLACDKKVIHLLRQRGLGNSSSSIQKLLEEAHSDRYLRSVHHYLTACRSYKAAGTVGLVSTTSFEEPPVRRPVPGYRWLMKIYQLDVLQRLNFIKASMTSLFGTVLKIDSTKKITKKLAGRAAKTSMWATNVGNEHGQVIMTVLTASEGQGLQRMIQGVCARYQNAKVPPPRILYVDRDCCGPAHIGKYFSNWPFLLVRLDIWHFMRRLSVGCTTDAHPLYGTFMSRLSHCIFRWDEEDVKLLKRAKRAEMIQQHIPDPSEADVVRQIKTDELALHCRRTTRGTRDTTTLITQLIQSLDGDHGLDVLGVPLINDLKMKQIWAQQSHHVACLQDPDGVQLYTRVGTVTKGGVELPKYRCARGSTSLESFHLHMNRFIPGTLASDVNFQVYLMDGVHRWNQDRQRQATVAHTAHAPLSYDGELRDSVNKLSNEVLGRPICPEFAVPGKYTGELIGLEYLYSQSTGASVEYEDAVSSMEEEAIPEEQSAEEEDEGFEEAIQITDLTVPGLQQGTDLPVSPSKQGSPQRSSTLSRPILKYPTDDEYRQMMEYQAVRPIDIPSETGPSTTLASVQSSRTIQSINLPDELSPATQEHSFHDDRDIGPDNIPGYSAVCKLAVFLCSLREQTESLSTAQAEEVVQLWDALSDYDKSRSKFPQRCSASDSGRFRSPKKLVAIGVTSVERAVLGPNSTRANWPDCNRYVEATVEELVQHYPSDKRTKGEPCVSRWTRINNAYGRIQKAIVSNNRVMERTNIQIPSLNRTTITQWYNKKGKAKEQKILLQGIQLPQPPMTGRGAPAPKTKPETLQVGQSEEFQFRYNPDTAGMAKLKVRQTSMQIRTTRPILPRPTVLDTVSDFPTPCVTFPLQQPTAIAVTNTGTVHRKHKDVTQPEVVRRKYTKTAASVMCPKCRQERLPPQHQQYMGYRYCGNTSTVPFSQWREDLKFKGAARKKKF